MRARSMARIGEIDAKMPSVRSPTAWSLVTSEVHFAMHLFTVQYHTYISVLALHVRQTQPSSSLRPKLSMER
jgi:hypothetical protein